MKDNFKKFLPHIAAIILFLVLSIIYMKPIVFDDMSLFQSDVISSSSWGKDLRDYHDKTGEYAFWSNSMFGGMPANYTFMPPFTNIFKQLEHVLFSTMDANVFIVFLFIAGAYIFMLSLGCSPWLSIVGAIIYGFTSFNFISLGAGHFNKCLVMTTMAPILGGIILCYRKKFLWGAITTIIFTGLNIYWSHQQITYYLLLTVLILAVIYFVYAIKEKTIKDYFISSGILAVAAMLAVAPSLGSLISTTDYAKDTMRGGAVLQKNAEGVKESSGLDIDYAFDWSYGKAETMTLLIPNFYGSSSHYNVGDDSEIFKVLRPTGQAKQFSQQAPMYWGPQLRGTAGPVYAGSIVCFLCVLGLIIVKGKEKWWLLGATILSIILAWGRHFDLNEFFFHYLPLYNKFRTPSMALTIAGVTMAALAVLSLKEIFDNKENRKIYLKPLYIAAGITGGLCLLFAVLGSGLMSFSAQSDAAYQSYPELVAAIVSDRKSMLSSDSWRSFIFIALAAGAIWYSINKKVKTTYIIAFIGILIFVDLWTVSKRYLNDDSFVEKKRIAEMYQPTSIDLQILQDKDPHYRVLNLASNTFNESTTSNSHKSIGGYSPAKLRRYQDIIDYYFSGNINPNVINMLNTKYIIVPSQQQGQQQSQPQVQYNSGALGNVWFVNELKWVDSPDEEIVAIKDFIPTQTAYIDKEWQNTLEGWESLQHDKDSTANIRLTDYVNPGNMLFESNSEMPHLAVFSEVFYKTWRAYIDGKEAPLIRVNYILRGLAIPAGSHKIELKCVDEVYIKGESISKTSSIITGIILLVLFGFAIWNATGRRPVTKPKLNS